MSSIIIKLASPENLKAIQDLNKQLFDMEYEAYDKTLNIEWTYGPVGEKYFTDRIKDEDGCALVAYAEEKVVGYLVGGLAESEAYRVVPKLAELENMFVLPEYRSQGVGTLLNQSFIDWCRGKGVKRLKVVAAAPNQVAIGFYRKGGFTDYALTLEIEL